MNKKNSNSKLSKMICMIVAAVFVFTTIAMPVYGLEDVSSAETVPQSVSAEVADTADVQVYEEAASSWRFQSGYNIAEQQDNGVSPNTATARAAYKAWSKTENGYINSKGQIIKGALKKGIDVSSWQGEIDWDKVKADGIDFAIIRCGYGSDQKDQDDSQWLRNVQECERVGMPYGVYLYSYANTETKARSEAQHTLRLLKEANADPDYPVYYDLEDSIVAGAGKTKIKKFAIIFCSTLEEADYEAGIYANLNWWNNKLVSISSDASFNKYDKWIAQYYYKCQYTDSEYRLWQCASDYYVDGIRGKVDLNFEFELAEETNNITRGWKTDTAGNIYFKNTNGTVAKSQWVTYRCDTCYLDEAGAKLTGKQTIDGKKYIFTDDGLLQKDGWLYIDGNKYYALSDGTIATGYKKIGYYYYLFDTNGIMKTGTPTVGGKQYKLFASGKACLHTAKTKSTLNYRTGPGTAYKRKGAYKKNKTVYVIRTSNGWSKLSTGYWVKSSYLKKITTYPKVITTFKKYKVKTTDGINYRTGPGTNYKKKGVYNKGTVRTIVAEKNGWGKTSTGYWIKLSYTKKI